MWFVSLELDILTLEVFVSHLRRFPGLKCLILKKQTSSPDAQKTTDKGVSVQ